MAARPRTRPRTARAERSPRSKKRNPSVLSRLNRPEVFATFAAIVVVAALLFVPDVQEALGDGRTWTLRTFGLGIVVLFGWMLLAAAAAWRGWYERGAWFWRKTSGIAALGVFLWGLLALNSADWTAGGVRFAEVSLGGTLGQRLIDGFLGKVAWLSVFVLAAALLAPTATRWVATNVPYWIEESWRRRQPQRAAAAVARWLSFIFRRPGGPEEEVVIGAGGFERIQPMRSAAIEGTPVVFRPSIDPASPTSPVGIGAAATFAAVDIEEATLLEDAPPAVTAMADDEAPDEPQQLGLDLDAHKGGWALPALEMLNAPIPSVHRKHDNAARAQLIVDTLASFGVDATVVEINEGPTVTQFGVEPGWEVRSKDVLLKDEQGKSMLTPDGRPRSERVEVSRTRVRVNRITALQNDLALALAAPSLRIEAPVPGRAIVGIEVPNDSASLVGLRAVMETREFTELASKSKLAMALGKGVSGVPVVADLAKMPHLLIAGSTGSGKSVCMNAIIAGIMMNATPNQVRFVMVDPKRVELIGYSGIPHMAFSEVIVDMDKVVGALQAVVGEMDARYKKFASVAVRNLEAYNKHPRVLIKLPQWVVIIDELADLMMAAPFEVEKLICRLAQLARATGIHLIVATQRPSVDVVTGLIKANFPTRIAFAVTSQTDSRTILDMGGAEKLLGRGDMLFMPTDVAKPIRIQGVYVSDAEVERLVEFWKDERFSELAPENADDLLEAALAEANGGDAEIEVDFDDPVVDRARALTLQHQRISPSLFQRRLKVGFVKAKKIIQILEEEGYVGPQEEGESRKVLQGSAIDDLA
ncbi:MAG: DNA translocase FtsK [Dehalococcoidia bacterium]|uniref:DNA translocase FtsK n=1 Tax=Candidatus Amarobacter glycogenicus TaxID=3140699 RepID=UPI003134C730|nr:DNA translocase FtsK [Dehalococcoidia bacterium]